MAFILLSIVALANLLLSVCYWLVLLYVVLGWLIMLQIINPYQPIVQAVIKILMRLMEPPLRWIRRFVPPWNGVDLSPVVLLAMIWFAQMAVAWIMQGFVLGPVGV